jgi:hypothetical protein
MSDEAVEAAARALIERWCEQANAERYIGGPNTSPMVEPDEYDPDDPPEGMHEQALLDAQTVAAAIDRVRSRPASGTTTQRAENYARQDAELKRDVDEALADMDAVLDSSTQGEDHEAKPSDYSPVSIDPSPGSNTEPDVARRIEAVLVSRGWRIDAAARRDLRAAVGSSPASGTQDEDEDHEAGIEEAAMALSQCAEFESLSGTLGSWRAAARAAVVAYLSRVIPSPGSGTEPTAKLVQRIVYFLRYIDWPDDTAADAVERKFGAGFSVDAEKPKP